jgi:hypothetical protein
VQILRGSHEAHLEGFLATIDHRIMSTGRPTSLHHSGTVFESDGDTTNAPASSSNSNSNPRTTTTPPSHAGTSTPDVAVVFTPDPRKRFSASHVPTPIHCPSGSEYEGVTTFVYVGTDDSSDDDDLTTTCSNSSSTSSRDINIPRVDASVDAADPGDRRRRYSHSHDRNSHSHQDGADGIEPSNSNVDAHGISAAAADPAEMRRRFSNSHANNNPIVFANGRISPAPPPPPLHHHADDSSDNTIVHTEPARNPSPLVHGVFEQLSSEFEEDPASMFNTDALADVLRSDPRTLANTRANMHIPIPLAASGATNNSPFKQNADTERLRLALNARPLSAPIEAEQIKEVEAMMTPRERLFAEFFSNRLAQKESMNAAETKARGNLSRMRQSSYNLPSRQYSKPEMLTVSQDAFTFFAVGDFGEPTEDIVITAEAMGTSHIAPKFVLGLGDNFYPSGVYSVEDELFVTHWYAVFIEKYEQMHTVPWFNSLGNHDYRGDINAQIMFQDHPRNINGLWRLPAMNYSFSVQYGVNAVAPISTGYSSNFASTDDHDHHIDISAPLLDLSVLRSRLGKLEKCNSVDSADSRVSTESEPPTLIEFFELDTNGVQFSVRNTYPETEYLLKRFINELDVKLAASTAKWKIVFGHHPLYTKGKSHGELGRRLGLHEYIDKHGNLAGGYGLEDVLVKNKVDAYMTGHEHKMQYHCHRGVHHFVSGAAGHNNRFYGGVDENTELSWVDDKSSNGFLQVDVTADKLVCRFISNRREMLKEVVIEKPVEGDDDKGDVVDAAEEDSTAI